MEEKESKRERGENIANHGQIPPPTKKRKRMKRPETGENPKRRHIEKPQFSRKLSG